MTRYNSINVKLSNSQFNEQKSEIKNNIEVTFVLSSNVIGDSNEETNFSHKLLLTHRQISGLCKAFANNSRNSQSRAGFLLPPHPLTNFKIQKYCQKTPKFNGFYSRCNLPKIEDGPYIVNLDDCKLYELIGQLFFLKMMQQHISMVPYFNIFKNELKQSQATKVSQQIFLEYKQMIQ